MTKNLTVKGAASRLLDASNDLDSAIPDWLRDLNSKGWQEFQSLPMPKRTDESWRFSDIKILTLEPFTGPVALPEAEVRTLADRSVPADGCPASLVFVNGSLAQEDRKQTHFDDSGIVFTSIERALDGYENIIRQHLMVQGAYLGSDKFAALHKAYLRSGTFLYVPDGVEVVAPLEVFHWLAEENGSTFPHTLIVAGRNSKVTLIDHFNSACDAPGFACAVNDLYVGEGAQVVYVCEQNWSQKVLSFQLSSTLVERDGKVAGLNLNLGAGYSRVESRSRLNGPGSRSDMLAVTVADNDQVFDLRTAQDHCERATSSDLLFKNALADRSRVIFSGIIRVEEGAHQTDAYQTNRSLMLSDEAESNSMPGLEILADDVKCSHGSTAGSVSPEEMFYLRARGIPEKVARQLMVAGFLDEVVARLPDETLAQRIRNRLAAKENQVA